MAQLYEACKGRGLMDSCWPTMEAVIGVQGSQALCVGEVTSATTTYQLSTRFAIACGVSVVGLSSGNRANYRAAASSHKGMQERGATSLKFKERFADQGERTDFTYDDMRNILRGTRSASDMDAKKEGSASSEMTVADMKKETSTIWWDYARRSFEPHVGRCMKGGEGMTKRASLISGGDQRRWSGTSSREISLDCKKPRLSSGRHREYI